MPNARKKSAKNSRPRSWRGLIVASSLAVMLVSFIMLSGSTRANFELPLIDNSNFPQADLTGVYSHFRSNRNSVGTDPESNSTGHYTYYESFAVGNETAVTGGTPLNLGAIFHQDADTGRWGKLKDGLPMMTSIGGWYDQNAGYSKMWFGGYNGSMYHMDSADKVDSANIIATNPSNIGGAGPQSMPIYAIGASDGVSGQQLAGGGNGNHVYFLRHGNGYGPSDSWTALTDTNHAGEVGDFPGAAETITSIAFAKGSEVAYVATSNFVADDFNRDGGTVTSLKHTCTASGTRGYLYRVIGHDWLRLTPIDQCIFGLAVLPRNSYPWAIYDSQRKLYNHVPNVIWLATSNDLYRFTEATSVVSNGTLSGPQAIGSSAPYFGIAAIPQIGGAGQNLIFNRLISDYGDLDYRTINILKFIGGYHTIGITNPINTPEFWTTRNNGKYAGSDCHLQDDFRIETGAGSQDRFTIEPLPSDAGCPANTGEEIVQRFDLSTIEGSTFKLTGKYSVEYTSTPSTIRQGGISIGCSGADANAQEIDCSLRNTSQIKVVNSAADNRAWEQINNGDGIVFSRQDAGFAGPIHGGITPSRAYTGAQYLEVRCQATVGVKVQCGDLKLEAVDSPSLTNLTAPYYDFEIVAVGAGPRVVSIPRALGAPTIGTIEGTPGAASTRDLTAVAAAGSQHVIVAGDENTLYQRLAGTLSGYIWAGTPMNAKKTPLGATGNYGLGWMATNCGDLKKVGTTSICDIANESFGITMAAQPDGSQILTGRAWFGKAYMNVRVGDDAESLSLGNCVNAARDTAITPDEPYNMQGSCDRTTMTCKNTTNGTKACNRDADCYGHCSKDQGFLCLTNADCVFPNTQSNTSLNNSNLIAPTPNRLQCLGNNTSPSACSNAGWLSFNENDFSGLIGGVVGITPDGGNMGVTIDGNGFVKGWARFMTLANPNDANPTAGRGWVSFQGPAKSSPAGVDIFACQSCTGAYSSTGATAETCGFCFDDKNQAYQPAAPTPGVPATSCYNYCTKKNATGNLVKCGTNADCAGAGDNCVLPGRCSNLLTKVCTPDMPCGTGEGTCESTGSICPSAGGTYSSYGVTYDKVTQQFHGFAWSSDFGWLDWGGVTSGSTRFIQTRQGNIYAKDNIGNTTTLKAPGGLCNATYLIISEKNITNFCSAYTPIATFESTPCSPSTSATCQAYAPVPFINPQNIYSNLFGRIDLKGIETDVTGGAAVKKSKYGAKIINLTPVSGDISAPWKTALGGATPLPLNNQIFIANPAVGNTTVTLDSAMEFIPGSIASGTVGNGVLIVNGNLYIKGNMSYKTTVAGTVKDLREIASLTVIVKGNVIIDNSVTSVIGSYFVTKNATGTGGKFCTTNPRASGDDCYAAGTTWSTNANQYPLTIHGLIIANAFSFRRAFVGTLLNPQASELIIQDGRLQSNPTRGMEDFINGLPNTVGSGP